MYANARFKSIGTTSDLRKNYANYKTFENINIKIVLNI